MSDKDNTIRQSSFKAGNISTGRSLTVTGDISTSAIHFGDHRIEQHSYSLENRLLEEIVAAIRQLLMQIEEFNPYSTDSEKAEFVASAMSSHVKESVIKIFESSEEDLFQNFLRLLNAVGIGIEFLSVIAIVYKRLTLAPQSPQLYEAEKGREVGTALNRLGLAYSAFWDYPKAIDYYNQAIAIGKEADNRKGIADSLSNLGSAYYSQVDYAKAIDFYQQSLEIRRELGDPNGIADSLGNLGNAYYSQVDYAKAIDFYQQSLEIKRELGDRHGIAASLNNLGNVYYSKGDYAKAIDFHQQSLEIKRELGDRHGIAASLNNLGSAYYSKGDYAKAIDFYQQSLEIKRELGDRHGIAASLNNLGNAYYSKGDYAKAIDFHQQSLEIKRELGDRHGQAISLLDLGNAYAKTDDHWKSREHYEQAKALFTELKLAHRVEECERAIQERNRIIAMQPKKALSLPTQNIEPDWLQKSMPQAASTTSTPTKRPIYKWLPYIAIGVIIFGLILLLQ